MGDDIDISDDDAAFMGDVWKEVGALRGGAVRKPNKFVGDADEATAIIAAMQRAMGDDKPQDDAAKAD